MICEEAKMAKTQCPIGRDDFWNCAEPLTVEVNHIPMTAEPKEFSTGSLGWYLNGKTTVKVGDANVPVQIGMNVTVIGSKNTVKTAPAKKTKTEDLIAAAKG
jgi:hypothetical protein